MQIDYEQLRQLLADLSDSDIQELTLEGQEFRLEVRRNLPGVAPAPLLQAVPVPQPVAVPVASPAAAPSPPPAAAASRSDLQAITALCVGIFYRSPAPGDPPFVEVGSRVTPGQTVCILEAMKTMNELEAEVGGEVVEILVENGTPVEFGQVLMRIRAA